MKLPNKSQIIAWQHEPTVLRLMKENRWTKDTAQQWFNDFMKWMYTCQRYSKETGKPFEMDDLHFLDEVWHAYILHTKAYFKMSKELFDVEYLHHDPENPFGSGEAIPDEVLLAQMNALVDDWGVEYVDRVWKYGADKHDLLAKYATKTA